MSKRWQAIEAEYGEPVRDVVQGFRDMGLKWDTVAEILGVTTSTLWAWRLQLGMRVSRRNPVYYDEDYRTQRSYSDRMARAAGFESMADAIRAMHMRGTPKIKMARRLGVDVSTVKKHTPHELKRTA